MNDNTRTGAANWLCAEPLNLRAVVAMASACLLAGCAVHRVETAPLPARGATTTATPMRPPSTDDAEPWWHGLADSQLDKLIRRALDENLDVAASRARIEQALTAVRSSAVAQRPSLGITGTVDDEVAVGGRDRQHSKWQADLGLDWQVDLFRRLGSTEQARVAEAWAREYETQGFRLSLSEAVAEAYFNIVEQRRLLELLDSQRVTANTSLRIITQRFEEGVIARLDVLQQQSQVADLESQIPAVRAGLQDAQNTLGALLGAVPGDAITGQAGVGASFPDIPELPEVADVDQRVLARPDVAVARARLISADADTARALADRLPRLTLSADAIRVTGRVTTASVLSVGADLVQPLLDWGQRREEWVRTKAVYRERMANFSQVYLRALWELDGLARSERTQRDLIAALERRRELLEATLKQANNRYDAGLTDYLPVLNATQQLDSVEQRLIHEQRKLTSMRIAMHGALGGALPPAAPMDTAPALAGQAVAPERAVSSRRSPLVAESGRGA